MGGNERAALVDEYGELDRQVAAFRPVADRHAELKRVIASWYDAEPADKSYVAQGRLYLVEVSERRKERRIVNLVKLFARLGKAKFLELARMPLAAVDALEEPKRAGLVEESRTGARTVGRAVARQAALKRAA